MTSRVHDLPLGGVALAVLAVAAAGRVDIPIPGSPVPQSLQTLAVVVVGGALGMRWGGVALLAYLALGALGLPVFAGGAAGASHLIGPTAGYLVGFVVAAAGVGAYGDRAGWSRLGSALLVLVLAHGAILLLGWTRLSASLGAGQAWAVGVGPFWFGGIAKSLVGAALLVWTPLGADAAAPGRDGDASR
ncbi:MAG: biotin transporter BioY [Gemmatimonadetes bacterium]|nr:biotin transporter BioY [Gemmatimonadota bacterium]NNK64503.1 biotin transporter BioY [Gemmatimonadota bacterium]